MAKKQRQTFNKRLLDAIIAGNDKTSVPASVMREYGMTESQIQQDCLRWFAVQYPMLAQEGMLFHIPNEGIRLGGMGARMKREGIVRGVADLCLCVPKGGYHALYIEMKKPGSYQRPEQKEWQRNVEKYGNRYVVCKTVEEFQNEVISYLKG
jgi:hypothetical protein